MNIGVFKPRELDEPGEYFIPLEIEELRKRGHEVKFFCIRGLHPNKEDIKWMDFAIFHFVPTAMFFSWIGVPFCVLPTANDIFTNKGANLIYIQHHLNCKFIGYQSFYHKRKYDEWGIYKPTIHAPHCCRTQLFKRQTPYNPSGRLVAGGRLIPKKGLDRLIDVENLTIFGDGPLMEELKEKLNCVRFTGYLNGQELKDLFEQSSIYLFPAIKMPNGDSDGIANTVKEALLMELQVISSSVAGMPEIENIILLDDWSKIKEVIKDVPKEPNTKGRKEILKLYTPEICVNMLLEGIKKYGGISSS